MRIVSAIRRFSPGLPHYLFAGAFLARLFALERLSRSALLLPARGDMHFYNDWAQQILRGDLSNHGAFYGLPLYPYVLALFYRIFGYSPFIPGLLQALLDSATAILIYLLSRHLFRSLQASSSNPHDASAAVGSDTQAKWFAGIAAVAWIFYVPAEAYSIILMPTAACVFAFWFVIWRIVRAPTAPDWHECLFLGLIIGLAAMAIATALFLVPLVLAAVWLKANGAATRTVWLRVAVFLTAVGIGTSPCWIHNYFIARDPVFLSAHSGVNFWIGNNPQANGYPRFPPGLRPGQAAMLQDSITTAEAAVGHPLKRAEVSAYWSGKAKSYIKNNFGAWLKLLLVKAGNFWNPFQYDDLSIITILREQNVILPGLKFGLVAALAIPGLLFALSKYPLSRWVAAAVLLQMASLLTVFVTERYRVAAVPGLLLGASFGVSELWQNCVSAKYSRVALYLVLLLAATLFVSIPQKDPGLWALDAYNSGWQALQSNNLPLAEQKLNVAYAYAPENAEVNFARGNLRLAQGNKSAAESHYLAALSFDPNHEGAYNNLGVLALEEKRWNRAADFLTKALREDPRDAKTHYLLARAQLKRGDTDAARAEIETALQLKPHEREFLAVR